jgi:hypothetical protein
MRTGVGRVAGFVIGQRILARIMVEREGSGCLFVPRTRNIHIFLAPSGQQSVPCKLQRFLLNPHRRCRWVTFTIPASACSRGCLVNLYSMLNIAI